MNLSIKIPRSLFVSLLLLLLMSVSVSGQEIPINQNHLINQYIERQISLGNLPQSDASVRPLTYTKVRNILKQLAQISGELSKKDQQLLQRFETEFSIDNLDSGLNFPFYRSNLKTLGASTLNNYQLNGVEPHFLSYKDTSIYAWADVKETGQLETIETSIYRRFTDRISILGSISERLSFYVNFTMNRFVGDSALVHQLDTFKNEDHPYFEFVNWTLWYQSEAAFNVSTKYGNFQLGKTPLIWGFSPNNSPILSGNTQIYPYINYSYKYKNFKFHFIHGSLLPMASGAIHISEKYPQKFIAAHRIELEINKDFMLSFNEMVIYGNRPAEIEYLIPVNFYWPAEHNQGDRDNLLMAIDCSWRIKPGLRCYNTLFWDELAWEKVFSKWWANKFIIQSGIHWVPQNNIYLSDFRIEATIARPWTYTHNEFVNSYASAGIGLGLPLGPNSQSVLVGMGFWPNYRWYVNISSMLVREGSGLGSSPTDNYDLRDPDLDENTPYLLGDIKNSSEFRLETNYSINRVVELFGKIKYKYPKSELGGYVGVTVDW